LNDSGWNQCVAAVTNDHVRELASWRGYSPEFCEWLKNENMIGIHDGNWALPVHGEAGEVIACHYRVDRGDGEKPDWYYYPSGFGVRPLIFGDPQGASNVFVFESPWDAFAVMDKVGSHKPKSIPDTAVIVTRGATNGKLVNGVLAREATVYAFQQNDTPGEKWLTDICANVGRKVGLVVTPRPHKDTNEWTLAGATTAEIMAAIQEAESVFEPLGKAGEQSARSTLSVISAVDLLETDFPQSEDLIAGILPQQSKCIISAPAKLGKTRFGLGLAIGLATGQPVMGFKITCPFRVLYFQAEVSELNLQVRLKKMLAHLTYDQALLRNNLLFCNARTLKLTNLGNVGAIRKAVAQHQPDAVVFDPLYKYNDGDESNVRDMTRFFDPLDALIMEFGVAILIVHHHGKARGENLVTPAHANRGSSTIADWADSLLTMTFEKAGADVVKLAFTLRNAEEPSPMAFHRNHETLWFDPLPDYELSATKVPARKIADHDVADAIGDKNDMAYSRLAESLEKKFKVSKRTAKDAIKRAAVDGSIQKTDAGRYVKTNEVQGADQL
jgi:hypothetical protein